MNSHRILKRIPIVITLIILVIIGVYLYKFGLKNPGTVAGTALGNGPSSISKQASVAPAQPARLIIPKIQVDTTIDPMGLTADGDMEAPAGPKTVGWYKFGTLPGETGSAVLDGHYGRWANGETSVFDNLHKLKKGDTMTVIDSKGKEIIFVVRELRDFLPESNTTDIFKSTDNKAHLNIITCDGSWNPKTKTYSKRLVVFTDLK